MKRLLYLALIFQAGLILAVLALSWRLGTGGAELAGGPADLPVVDLALGARVDQFAALAKQAPAAAAKAFQVLAVPFDEIELEGKKVIRVEPAAEFLGSPGSFVGKVTVKEIGEKGAGR